MCMLHIIMVLIGITDLPYGHNKKGNAARRPLLAQPLERRRVCFMLCRGNNRLTRVHGAGYFFVLLTMSPTNAITRTTKVAKAPLVINTVPISVSFFS